MNNCNLTMDSIQILKLCTELSEIARSLEAGKVFSKNNTHGSDTDLEERASVSQRISTINRHISGIVARLQDGPDQFLYHLASQNQILACVKWLSDHQVVACLPLRESIPVEELANLADVDKSILSRVVRLMASVGYLKEVQPGHVAHTPLSTHFTTELSSLDAITFLASEIAPLALRLTSTTENQSKSKFQDDQTWTQAEPLGNSDHMSLAESPGRPQIKRQWAAYCQKMGKSESIMGPIINHLNWQGLGQATVVHICATQSELSNTFARIAPTIRVIVQFYESTPSETMAGNGSMKPQSMPRKVSTMQTVGDAAVYIVQPDASLLPSGTSSLSDLVASELRSHLHVLRANPASLLILAPPLLPEPGSVSPQLETQARVRDFAQLQLTHDGALELAELYGIVQGVDDNDGALAVCNEMRSQQGHVVGLTVKYQSRTDAALLSSNTDFDMSWGDWSSYA